MKGYSSAVSLAAYMGMTFTTAQATIAGIALGAAEVWIDNETRHAWLEATPIVESQRPSKVGQIRLNKPPVKSIEKVSVRWWPGQTLVEASLAGVASEGCGGYYYVQSLRDGVLTVYWAAGAFEIVVEYTPNTDAVPDEIILSTNVIAASFLRNAPTFNGDIDPTMIQRYVIGGELEVEFRKNLASSAGAIAQAYFYLANWIKGYTVV